MASHNGNDFSSPQEAIEGYLEALLQDVADYEEPEDALQEEPAPIKAKEIEPETAAETVFESETVEETVNKPLVEDQGTRVFAPSGEEQTFAPPVAKTQIDTSFERPTEVAYQETPTVVMPELQIAEPVAEQEAAISEPVVETVEPEPEVAEPVVETVVAEPEPVIDTPEPAVVEEIDEPIVETSVAEPEVVTEEAFVKQVILDEPVSNNLIDENIETEVEEEVKLQPQENEGWTDGRPNWAQGRFECLLFVVKGLKLAVPLAELGGIHKQEKEPTPLFGQPGWFLGILRNNRMNIGLVDTAQWVMPEYIDGDHNTDYRFAIHIHNSEWGLACDEVAEAISLDPNEVKWRTKLGRRPWLAGTVVDHMCALIDVAAFARLLDSDKVPVDLQALNADGDEE